MLSAAPAHHDSGSNGPAGPVSLTGSLPSSENGGEPPELPPGAMMTARRSLMPVRYQEPRSSSRSRHEDRVRVTWVPLAVAVQANDGTTESTSTSGGRPVESTFTTGWSLTSWKSASGSPPWSKYWRNRLIAVSV